MTKSKALFDKCGGYRKLHSFTFATLAHLGTISFCHRFVSWKDDPLGKTAGQMIGAARSGRQNIIEGSERSATSKETEIKLTDVGKASLAELLGDYEIYLAEKGVIPWSVNDENRQAFSRIMLPGFEWSNDALHAYWQYYHNEVKPLFTPWLEHADDIVVANAMIVLLQRTMGMLHEQLKSLGKTFLEEGGFREKMYHYRTEASESENPNLPQCPDCGKAMRIRTAKSGNKVGNKFWGCASYPDCRKTLPFT